MSKYVINEPNRTHIGHQESIYIINEFISHKIR
jgi:hypothetical protein